MTTPTGQISFSEIIAEFGPSDPVSGHPNQSNFGDYRVNQTVGDRNWLLDDGVPTPGNSISFSQLKGKSLNCVVDYSTEEVTVNSGSKFDSSAVVIGGFKSIPSRSDNSQTKKVYHLVRNKLGSTTNGAVAFRTSTWDSNTLLLRYIVNGSGKLYGKGGDPNGGSGSPAFGVDRSCEMIIESGGEVRGGGGAGGRGGNYSFSSFNYSCSANGGTGGHGRGYDWQTQSLSGSTGVGGPGGRCNGSACGNCDTDGTSSPQSGGGAGGGGTGGDWGSPGCGGCNAGSTGPITGFPLFESESIGGGSGGGSAGAAIIRASGTTISLTNNGTTSGDTNAVGSFS